MAAANAYQDRANRSAASADPSVVTIKKYANRRLYNTASSSYVTLDALCRMVKNGEDFVVYDAKTGEDITRSVLTQIIFEEEAKGENLLPINFLRQLIRFYGDSMQGFVPGYLEMSLETFARNQEEMRAQMTRTFGDAATPFDAMQSMAQRNMAWFENAMKVFNPFAAGARDGAVASPPQPQPQSQPRARPEPAKNPQPAASANQELEALRKQMAAMQAALDAMRGEK